MNLTKDKLRALWNRRKEIFAKPENKELIERFNFLTNLFAEISQISIRECDNNIYLNDREIVFKDNEGTPDLSYFGCENDEMSQPGAFNGIEEMASWIPCHKDLIRRIGCMLGGFTYDNFPPRMLPLFRIISNTIKDGHDNGTLTSTGQMRHPSSNFADNNYFFNVIFEINRFKNDKFNYSDSKIVLRWPNTKFWGTTSHEEIREQQREILRYRFPYKFFYMWTHKKECLHLIGLQAYKGLITQPDIFNYAPDSEMNLSIEEFTSEQGWRAYSKKIGNLICEESEMDEKFLTDLSKLLSIVMLQEQDGRDIYEMLHSGNYAIILWGPPGTGKTYSAQNIVMRGLGITTLDELKDSQFQPLRNQKEISQGQWAIVQFHPNYTYEDFIGGISPRLNGDTLSYELKEGIFKQLCDEANKPDNRGKRYYLIIDEINRADLSSVFGELMYGLEYRGHALTLPNFPSFVIPENVYLIGTMNSVDKSLATFDLALRRRFSFFKIMPNLEVLSEILSTHNFSEETLKKYIIRCKELNKALCDPASTLRLGADFQIGQAYFAKIKDFFKEDNCEEDELNESATIEISTYDLERLWDYNLQPLIEEYVGNRLDDEDILNSITRLHNNFIAPLSKD